MSTFRRSARSLTLAAVSSGLALLVPGCGPSPSPAPKPATPPPAAAEEWKPSEGCTPPPVPDGPYDLMGDPRACKGGRITLFTNSYPTHLNFYGPDRDNDVAVNYVGAMFLPLVYVDLNTFKVVPQLASSWEEKVSGKDFTFHIDADAKWSDGTPVTAKDVVATYDLIHAPEVTEVQLKAELDSSKFDRPQVIDDKTVRWTMSQASWRNLIIVSEVPIYPAHLLDPKTYLDQWKWKPPVTDGPYDLGAFETGKYIEFVRTKDWWGAGKRPFIGLYNFDSVYWKVINDANIAFEAFKKGDIDYYLVTKAQRWMEETEFDKVKNGWIQKQKMYMREPQVQSEMAFNLTDPLFQDVRVRKALFWLYDREYLHDQLFYHQYTNKNSYFANSIYENPDNEKVTFNPEKGLALLAEAGWTRKDTDGVLMKDGKRFEFDFIYIHPDAERVYTPIQEKYRQFGIKMNLKLIQPSAWVKVSQEKTFQLIYANWSSTPFPIPRDSWDSKLADQKGSNNICHFKNAEVDALLDQYDTEFDLAARAKILQKMDAILYDQTPYLLDWYSDNYRNLWWDKFGMPSWCSWAGFDIRFTNWQTWWYDEARAKRLDEAMKAGTPVPRPPAENTAWKAR